MAVLRAQQLVLHSPVHVWIDGFQVVLGWIT